MADVHGDLGEYGYCKLCGGELEVVAQSRQGSNVQSILRCMSCGHRFGIGRAAFDPPGLGSSPSATAVGPGVRTNLDGTYDFELAPDSHENPSLPLHGPPESNNEFGGITESIEKYGLLYLTEIADFSVYVPDVRIAHLTINGLEYGGPRTTTSLLGRVGFSFGGQGPKDPDVRVMILSRKVEGTAGPEDPHSPSEVTEFMARALRNVGSRIPRNSVHKFINHDFARSLQPRLVPAELASGEEAEWTVYDSRAPAAITYAISRIRGTLVQVTATEYEARAIDQLLSMIVRFAPGTEQAESLEKQWEISPRRRRS